MRCRGGITVGLRPELRDVLMRYGDKTVLQGCSVEFPPGVTAIMGPNGCGKSTLLRIAAMLEAPTAGSVLYRDDAHGHEGGALRQDLSLRRRVTLTLPRGGIFNASVFDNAAYGLRVRGVGRQELRQRVEEVLAAVGLADKAAQRAGALSTGQSQRLAIARALVLRPEVLFLDEPTASVDEENTELIESLITAMKTDRAGGIHPPCIVLTTHDRGQAQRLADRIREMRRGQFVA